MKTYEQEERNQAPDARDFVDGNYLLKEDIEGPTVVTIEDVRDEDVKGSQRRKLVAYFREFTKPLILNKTNIKRLANIFKTSNTGLWRGPVSIYVDETVEYAGQTVGGIRVQPATGVRAAAQDSAQNGHMTW